jgi:hypothetical protein
MNTFIDLNAKPDSGTLFRLRAVTPDDIKKAITNGRIVGFVASFLTAVVVAIFATQLPEHHPLAQSWLFWVGALLFVVLATFFGGKIRVRRLERESRQGFLRIDPEQLQFQTTGRATNIDMGQLFGAAPEDLYPDKGLRLCFLSDTQRGFISLLHSFKDYEIVEGPKIDPLSQDSDGNEVARAVILYYIGQRRSAGMPVAELPAFAYDAKREHHKHLVVGEHILDISFECDGKMLSIFTDGETYALPVTSVKEVDIQKETVKGSPTRWEITLALDPSCGHESLLLNILNMSRAEEVEYYLVCLPTLFPQPKL